LKLTGNRQLQKYIALIDNRIRFDEIPLSRHGHIIFYMTNLQFQTTQPGNVLYGFALNGLTSLFCAHRGFCSLQLRLKTPSIRPRALPNRAPNWLRFLLNGEPYPNVVGDESSKKSKDDCHRYFHNRTSIRVCIGIKVWVADRELWVGWGEWNAAGNGACIHTNMQFLPHHSSIQTPVNVITKSQ